MMQLAAWTDVFVKYRFLNNEVWRWVALLGVLLASFLLGKVVSFLLDRQSQRLQRRNRAYLASLLGSLAGPVTLLLLAAGLYLASALMNLTYTAQEDSKVVTRDLLPFWQNVARTIAVLAVTWVIFRLVSVIELLLKRWTSRTQTTLDDQLVPIIRKALRVFVVIMAGLFVAQNIFRMDIAALVAGLGLGGLAFALAARDSLANFFGSVTIFADRPFQLGDWVKIGDYQGFIEEVGFRSTRLRTLEGPLVTIPNSVVANASIENIARRPSIRRVLNVTITYDTPPEKVQRAVAIIRELLEARKDHFPQDRPPQVYFNDFNAASLNIIVYFWFVPPDFWQYLAFNHEFNMELLRRYNAEGIEFAFPTQTLYVRQDSPLAADVRLGSEAPSAR